DAADAVTASDVVRRLRTEHGLELQLAGRCPGGEAGAYYVDDREGRRHVLKWFAEPLAGRLGRVVRQVSSLREVGYPAPEHLPPLAISGAVVVIQEAVRGMWRDDVGDSLVDQVLRLNELQGGRAEAATGWAGEIQRSLVDGADGYCLHEPLRRH